MTTVNVYRTPPQMEKRASDELAKAGVRHYVPLEPRTHRASHGRKPIQRLHPVAPGYVFAVDAKPFDAVYVKQKVGVMRLGHLRPLMLTGRVRPRRQDANPFKPGDVVVISALSFTDAGGKVTEVRAKVLETRSRTCIIAYDMLGKTHQQAIAYAQLRPG